jgi:hypothetical protein
MKQAVGMPLSNEAILKATGEAIKKVGSGQ